MFYMTWQTSGEKQTLYTPGVETRAEQTPVGITVTTIGVRGDEYKKLNFTEAEAETLTMEKLP